MAHAVETARLAVVIPVLNEARNLEACLHGVGGLGCPGLQVESIVVADGGSEDGTPEIAAAAGASVVRAERGRGTQLRAAIDATNSEWVLMLHADSRLLPEAGSQLATALNNPKTVCGAFRQRIDAEGWAYRTIEWGNAFRARRFGLPYGDQAIFARRVALDEAGGVSDMPLMEDVDLMQRLRRIGWPILLEGPVVVSARRWRRHGLLRQTLQNWALLTAFTLGVPVRRLERWYKPENNENAAAPRSAESVN